MARFRRRRSEGKVYKPTFNVQGYVDVRTFAAVIKGLEKMGYETDGVMSEAIRCSLEFLESKWVESGFVIPEPSVQEAIHTLVSRGFSVSQLADVERGKGTNQMIIQEMGDFTKPARLATVPTPEFEPQDREGVTYVIRDVYEEIKEKFPDQLHKYRLKPGEEEKQEPVKPPTPSWLTDGDGEIISSDEMTPEELEQKAKQREQQDKEFLKGFARPPIKTATEATEKKGGE